MPGVWRPVALGLGPGTGELWVGDDGQDLWEEVDLIVKGGNYGWSSEKEHIISSPAHDGAKYIEPVIEYPHRPESFYCRELVSET